MAQLPISSDRNFASQVGSKRTQNTTKEELQPKRLATVKTEEPLPVIGVHPHLNNSETATGLTKAFIPHEKGSGNKLATNLKSNTVKDPPNRRNGKLQQVHSLYPKVADITSTATVKTFFYPQIEAIMHAFGEVRHCSGEVLQIVETTTRQFLLYLIQRAVGRKTQNSNERLHLTVEDVLDLICSDARLVRRAVGYVKKCGFSKETPVVARYDNYAAIHDLFLALENEKRNESATASSAMQTTGQIREPTAFQDKDESEANNNRGYSSAYSKVNSSSSFATNPTPAEQQSMNNMDIMAILISRANAALNQIMSQGMFQEYCYCKRVTLTSNFHPQKNNIGDRIEYFLQWLGISCNEIVLEEPAVHVLGYLAWEAIGLITQTSLLLRLDHNAMSVRESDRLESYSFGLMDPRASYCTTSQQFVLVLRHGLATLVTLPLNDYEIRGIVKELEKKSCLIDGFSSRPSDVILKKHDRLQPNVLLQALRFWHDMRKKNVSTSVLANLVGDSLCRW